MPCKSSNDEPRHWLAVLKLHRASYFATHLGPFIIPVPAPTSCSPAKGSSCSPTKSTDTPRKNTSSVTNVRTRTTAAELGMKEPQTPSSCRSSSVDGSPSSVTSSSARSSHAEVRFIRDLLCSALRFLKCLWTDALDSSYLCDPFLHRRCRFFFFSCLLSFLLCDVISVSLTLLSTVSTALAASIASAYPRPDSKHIPHISQALHGPSLICRFTVILSIMLEIRIPFSPIAYNPHCRRHWLIS